MAATEIVLGCSTFPWRLEFNKKNIKVIQGNRTVLTCKSKTLKEISFENFLLVIDGKLQDHFQTKPQFQIVELEAKFTEWKKCLK